MNSIPAIITEIDTDGHLSLVKIDAAGIVLRSIVIDTPATNELLFIGNRVSAVFKEAEVMIGVGNSLPISLQNRIKGSVQSVQESQLLTQVVLSTSVGEITSIITSNAVKQLKLKVGTKATALIKTNEIMLSS